MSIWLLALFASTVQAAPQELTLGGDYLAMDEVRDGSGKSRLAVVVTDHSHPQRHRTLTWMEKRGGQLVTTGQEPLGQDVAAYDVCRLDPKSPATTLLLIRPQGVYRYGDKVPLVAEPTLFAHARDNELPRVHICYDLYKDESPALVVPTLPGVSLFRAAASGYQLDARLPVDAESHYFRSHGEIREGIQRITVNLAYPDLTMVDFDGDGRFDLCQNLGERLTCFLQGDKGFSASRSRKFFFDLLTESDRLDAGTVVLSHFVQTERGAPPDIILQKSNVDPTAMSTALYLFRRKADGGFAARPAQTISRQGFFDFHDYLDIDGDGLTDIVAPVAPLGWSDLVRVILSHNVDVDIVAYKSIGGKFTAEPETLATVNLPVDLKNIENLLGALPVWDLHWPRRGGSRPGERQVALFPGRNAIEVYALSSAGAESLWKIDARIGADNRAVDLDGDGFSELICAYPREAGRSDRLLFIDTPR